MDNTLEDKELQLLPTKKFYDLLDNGKDGCQSDAFYNLAKQILNHYNGLQDVSNKILKGLCYAYGNNFLNESDNDICNFLYYWLGDILYNNLIHMIYFDSVMHKLFQILRIRNGIKCTPPTYYNINEGKNFKNIKLFFDYSKDYDTYEKQITNNNLPCNKNYNEYLKKYVVSYNEFEGKCKDVRNSSGYCKAFNEYFNEKNPANLSNWTCNLQDNKPVEEKPQGKIKEMDVQELPANGRGEESVTSNGVSEGVREQSAEPPSSLVHPSSEGNSEVNSVSPPSYDPPSPTITKSIVTAASAAGLLMPPFLIYNFTPVRSWINKLLGRNQIYRNPLTERELIENSYQPHHFDSERNRYNISYRPE